MKEDKIEKIFAQLDRLAMKLDFIARSLEVFDPPADDGRRQNSEE